jgi:hypothetical protein
MDKDLKIMLLVVDNHNCAFFQNRFIPTEQQRMIETGPQGKYRSGSLFIGSEN